MGCLAATLAPGRIQSIERGMRRQHQRSGYQNADGGGDQGCVESVPAGIDQLRECTGHGQKPRHKMKEVKFKETDNFANLIKVRVTTDKDYCCVKGTLFGKEGRIVMINDYRVDFVPQGWLMIGPHIDRPGIIGKVGTILGSQGINIASMQVGRSEKAGNQMMVLSVESAIPAAVLEQLKAMDGIMGATMVNFESLRV